MSIEKYKPSSEEIAKAEGFLNDVERKKSEEREEAFLSLKPPRLNRKSGTIILDLDSRLIDIEQLRIRLESQMFEPKDEFHFTVVGTRNGKKLAGAIKSQPGLSKKVGELIRTSNWELGSTPQIYKVTKEYAIPDPKTGENRSESRQSVVQVLDLPGLDAFYRNLNAISSAEIEPQFPHITLFTMGDKMGIAINSREEFEKMSPEQL